MDPQPTHCERPNAPHRPRTACSRCIPRWRVGFIGAGYDPSDLKNELQKAAIELKQKPINACDPSVLPISVGFINWGVDLSAVLEALSEHLPAAVWFFAPRKNEDLIEWTRRIRILSNGRTKIWIQIGTVSDAAQIAQSCRPDVLVVQGADGGGHGLAQGASVVSLLPEVSDALAEVGLGEIPLFAIGDIAEGRGTAASLVLGVSGVVMGTRFLASKEANIAQGYQQDVIRTKGGGSSTVRTSVYDQIRQVKGWPRKYDGRGIINQSFVDAQNGKAVDENTKLYSQALQKGDAGWGVNGRLTAYAGSAVGLVRDVKSAQNIVEQTRRDALEILSQRSRALSKL